MVEWSQLLLPILLSGVLVFVVSSVMHTVLTYHNSDFMQLGHEDEVRDALRKGAPNPGMYMVPYCADHKQKGSPEFTSKLVEGPVGVLLMRRAGPMKIGPFLVQWMIYTLVISALVAYLGHSTLPIGATYMEVFRVVGAAAWLAYAWQAPTDSIWKGQTWSHTGKVLFDGLIYAVVTAGVFAWLWPG